MIRFVTIPLLLVALVVLSAPGCRSCSSCSDHSPPVANCDCAMYGGGQRAGSAFVGNVVEEQPQYYEPVPAGQ